LIDEFCAHRGVSLWFGRVEECGIRCAYHGWKYDVNGQCLEVPSELEHNNFARKVKLTSYPLVKVGDILWTYMGDPEEQPELPEFEFAQVPTSRRTPRSAGRRATGSRPSKGASTRATSPGCTREASRAIRSSRARGATSTT
jgi:phenylpropionate dioxygenase-like ring-hydroxylating dioxygenase large terminal subunit